MPEAVRAQTNPVRSKRKPPAEAVAVAPVAATPTGPVAPTWLAKGKGLEIWQAMAPTLALAKLLTAADHLTFGRYCRNFQRWLDLNAALDKDGMSYVSTSNHGELKRHHPAAMLAFRVEALLMAAEDRFGLNPAERQRIMSARHSSGGTGELFPPAQRPDDPAAKPAQPTQPMADDGPVGFLN